MASRNEKRQKFLNALIATGKSTVTLDEIKAIAEKLNIGQPYWFTNDDDNRIKRGTYKVPGVTQKQNVQTVDMQAQVIPMQKVENKSSNRISSISTTFNIKSFSQKLIKLEKRIWKLWKNSSPYSFNPIQMLITTF